MGVMSDDWYRSQAEAKYGSEGSIEIDAGAVVSNGADRGAYVAAWVWVEDPDEEGE